MMKQITIIFLLIAVAFFNGFAQNITMAISDFVNNTQNFALENRVPELLKTELSLLGGITLVERSKLNAVLQEQALGQTGIIDSENAQKVGKLLGAQFVLTGEINRSGDRIRIDVHMIHTETGEVFAEKVTGPTVSAIDPMLRLLAFNIKHNLLGQGQRKERELVRNYRTPWIFAAGIGTGIAGYLFHDSYRHHYDKYQSAKLLADFDDNYDKARQNYQLRNVLIGTSAAIFVTGFVLYLNGNSDNNKIFAHRTVPGTFSILPYYDAPSQSMGILLTISR
ncbi:hypothetical protein JW935_29365 [candidate division KSB1 bacterium]|nr:hypothetical protein [candidate division KSB1 bacterium]